MATLTLDRIQLKRIQEGGYQIHCGTPLTAGARRFLCVENATNQLDITSGYNATKLPALLKCIESLNAWGGTCRCWIVEERGGQFAGESPAQDLACPVKPYDGKFTFEGFANARPKLTYPGNGKGRLLVQLDGTHFFRNGSLLETADSMRGFDCTTFPMALFQCNVNMSGKYGTALAVALGATACGMEQKKEADVKAFFADKTKTAGLFFMWSAGHVVLVKNSTIHEFTYGGYKRTAAQSWAGYRRAPQGLWWIRKLPATLSP